MKTDKHNAFTFIEVMVSMAIVLMLAGIMLTGMKYLKTQGQRQLTQSAIEVIGAALEQYYDQTQKFPPVISNATDLQAALSAFDVTVVSGMITPSASVYHFLGRVPQSKSIIETLAGSLIDVTTGSVRVQIDIQMVSGGPTVTHDWPRMVDAWGTTLRYQYLTGYTFPVITSAGPDKSFGTDDDLKSQ